MKPNIEITKHIGVTKQEINEKGEHLIYSDDFQNQNIYIAFALPDESIEFEKLKYRKASYYVFKNLLSNVKNKLIIMDNGQIHKKEETRKIEKKY